MADGMMYAEGPYDDGAGGMPPQQRQVVFSRSGEPLDERKAQDILQLRSQLNDMRRFVDSAATKFDPEEQAGGGRASGRFDPGEEPIPTDPLAIELDVTQLPVYDGTLLKKGDPTSRFRARKWVDRRVIIEHTRIQLFDARRQGDAIETLQLLPTSQVVEGDDSQLHANKKVAYTFHIEGVANQSGPVEFSAESTEVREQWVESITMVIQEMQAVESDNQQQAEAFEARLARSNAGFDTSGMNDSGFGGEGEEGELEEDEEDEEAAFQREEEERAAQVAQDIAQQHFAHGSGLHEAVRGEQAEFTIEARNEAGIADHNATDPSLLKAVLENDELEMELELEDGGDGMFYCSYTAAQTGEFELRVTYDKQHIYGSPFVITVGSAPTAPLHCRTIGDGLERAVVGRVNSFRIVAMDQFDEPRSEGGDEWLVEIHGPGKPHPVVDLENGQYDVKYEVDLEHPSIRAQSSGMPELVIEVSLIDPRYQGLSVDPTRPYKRPLRGGPFQPVITMDGGSGDRAGFSGGLPSPAGTPLARMQHGMSAHQLRALAASGSGSFRFGEQEAKADEQDAGAPGGLTRNLFNTAPAQPASAAVAGAGGEAALAEQWDQLRRGQAQLEDDRSKLEADKRAAAQQLQRVQELSAKVQRDSERLAEYAAHLKAQRAEFEELRQGLQQQQAAGQQLGSGALGGSLGSVPSPARVPAGSGGSGAAASPAHGQVAASPAHSAAAAASAAGAGGAAAAPEPAEGGDDIFHPDVIKKLEEHERALTGVYDHYRANKPGLSLTQMVTMLRDFDIVPTFLASTELRVVFNDAAAANNVQPPIGKDGNPRKLRLPYAVFVEAVSRVAVVALSKPAFKRHYEHTSEKVTVVLEMWGLADSAKLQAIKENPPVHKSRRSKRK